MEKELCFIINDKRLYLEKILVDYENIPLFFLVKSGKEYYIALCYDIEDYNYYVARVSLADVFRMLHQKKTMRDMFLSGDSIYEIISGDEIQEDVVKKLDEVHIDKSVLPKEGAMFDILTSDIKKYVDIFDSEYLCGNFMVDKGIACEEIIISDDINIHVDYFNYNKMFSQINRLMIYGRLIIDKKNVRDNEAKVINYSGDYTDIITEKQSKIDKEENRWSDCDTIASFAA